ncbi:MAG TPA: MBL fold metallo-hydrolase [Solirubrobacterales bacterium]|jgi:glyoxylase-like metal-dependent hydrolase (beta-lactamase superfamily II)|nr:MBL fold metallo-hydrolase [Solirubrobacterales bacterium]
MKFAVPFDSWFRVAPVEPGVHLVGEPGHVNSWLIRGEERSVLLDTGLGLADISAAVATACPEEPEVVNSHTHFDHVGGNELFAATAMHELGPQWIEAGCDPAQLSAYCELAPAMLEGYGRLLAADRTDFFLIGPDEEMRPWPGSEIAAGGWRIEPPAPTRLLAEGDEIDLGGRVLKVIHTPGHAPDHICLIDERAGILWAQDQAYYGPHLVYEPGSDLSDFVASARRLADQLAGSLRTVYSAHCLRPAVPPAFLGELADAAEAVAAGEAPLTPSAGFFSEPVRSADFGHFSILLPG